jgi:AraC family transcriptional regulator, transcriptional activator of pobA
MSEFLTISSISQLHELLGYDKPKHPLLTVIDYAQVAHNPTHYQVKIVTDFYLISLKSPAPPTLQYGRNYYDFAEGTMLFMGPGQVFSVTEPDEPTTYDGWGLYVHPDLLVGTALARKIREYTFFSYAVHEALHLSEKEQRTFASLIEVIRLEYSHAIDHHSQGILITQLEQVLNYALRFYERQFITRRRVNTDFVSRFETLLNDYLQSKQLSETGLPTVEYFADQLHLSPGYLTDLLKQETGRTTKEHVQLRLIEEAKHRLLNSQQSVSEIAYDLGFTYPQYFNRLFKIRTGTTPMAFRRMN